MELASTTPPSDTIQFSNLTIVRDQDGELTAWVGSEKILGVVAIQMNNGACGMSLPMSRVRLAENVPATPVLEIKNNVIQFPKFRKAAAALVVDNTTPDDAVPA